MAYGDEYFAELDYIETVEKFKEDYEAEAIDDEEYREKSPPPDEEEEDEQPPKPIGNTKKRYSYAEDNDFMPSQPVPFANKSSDLSIRYC